MDQKTAVRVCLGEGFGEVGIFKRAVQGDGGGWGRERVKEVNRRESFGLDLVHFCHSLVISSGEYPPHERCSQGFRLR